jgi:hypothetical protein
MNTPSSEQVYSAKTWAKLYEAIGIHPRNTSRTLDVQKYVRDNFPDAIVCQTRRYGAFTDEQFTALVAKSSSVRQVIKDGGWKEGGGTYNMIKQRISKLGLDTSHFLGCAHQLGKTKARKHPIEYYLTKDSRSIGSHSLKLRLIKENIKTHKCENCGLSEWLGEPIPINLDHIDGDHFNNLINNLRILCPNCHAKTPTFGSKKNAKENLFKTR